MWFPTKRGQDSLEKWLIPRLGQEKVQEKHEHLRPEIKRKEVLKSDGTGQGAEEFEGASTGQIWNW